jgi:ADYC domain
MRRYIGLVVVALTVGCATEALETSETDQALKQCPDPDDCTVSNGGGVYTQEMGTVGIGPNHYMMARFVNTANGVSIEGRGYKPQTGNYYGHPASIYYAMLNNNPSVKYQVVSVIESLTTPKFTLSGPNGPITRTGTQILDLQLVIFVDDNLWTLSFADHTSEALQNDPNTFVQEFHAMWNQGEGISNPHEYCLQAPVNQIAAVDPVVFQQGILVNPITAVMARDNDYVTLSCRHGAIATVRWWGYMYRGDAPSAVTFEAAMHMKRASYCGDETFFTRRNTPIMILDSKSIQTDPVTSSNVEAVWGQAASGPIRATCVNLANLRHPNANYPADPSGNPFDGNCYDNQNQFLFTIPACGSDLGDLADAPGYSPP